MFKKKIAKKFVAKKTTQAVQSASWMAQTQAKVIFTAVATAFTHKLLQRAASKYPKLSFLQQKV